MTDATHHTPAHRPNPAKSAPEDRHTAGPFDLAEVPAIRPYIDFGAIKVIPREGQQLRLEVDERTKRVVAITIDVAGSILRVQAFAAPKTTGIWHGLRSELTQQFSTQGAQVSEVQGELGPELHVVNAATSATQNGAARTLHCVGVDGPRWMLRGVIMGKGTEDPQARTQLNQIFRELVVVRGDVPLPPNELLPLRVPSTASTQPPVPPAGGKA